MMNVTEQKRAKVGGEIGANGEFYKGGAFINTVAENAKKARARKGSGKVEVEPYKWEIAPEGRKPLFRWMGVFIAMNRQTGKVYMCASDTTLAYYAATREWAQGIADRYNAGQRWE